MVGTSMFIFSVGFFINSVSPAYSNSVDDRSNIPLTFKPTEQRFMQVPINEDGSINVKLSDEQMEELKSEPMDKIGSYYYIGCGSGIYRTSSSNPSQASQWQKVL
jgi:hypothetical protein